MKFQLVDRKNETPFIVLSAENPEEREQLKKLVHYKEPLLLEADPGFKIHMSLTRKDSN